MCTYLPIIPIPSNESVDFYSLSEYFFDNYSYMNIYRWFMNKPRRNELENECEDDDYDEDEETRQLYEEIMDPNNHILFFDMGE